MVFDCFLADRIETAKQKSFSFPYKEFDVQLEDIPMGNVLQPRVRGMRIMWTREKKRERDVYNRIEGQTALLIESSQSHPTYIAQASVLGGFTCTSHC